MGNRMKRRIRTEQGNRDRVRGLAGAVSHDLHGLRAQVGKLHLLVEVLIEHLGVKEDDLAALVRARATAAQLQREVAQQPANGEATAP